MKFLKQNLQEEIDRTLQRLRFDDLKSPELLRPIVRWLISCEIMLVLLQRCGIDASQSQNKHICQHWFLDCEIVEPDQAIQESIFQFLRLEAKQLASEIVDETNVSETTTEMGMQKVSTELQHLRVSNPHSPRQSDEVAPLVVKYADLIVEVIETISRGPSDGAQTAT